MEPDVGSIEPIDRGAYLISLCLGIGYEDDDGP
jgi:hypothetical protein